MLQPAISGDYENLVQQIHRVQNHEKNIKPKGDWNVFISRQDILAPKKLPKGIQI